MRKWCKANFLQSFALKGRNVTESQNGSVEVVDAATHSSNLSPPSPVVDAASPSSLCFRYFMLSLHFCAACSCVQLSRDPQMWSHIMSHYQLGWNNLWGQSGKSAGVDGPELALMMASLICVPPASSSWRTSRRSQRADHDQRVAFLFPFHWKASCPAQSHSGLTVTELHVRLKLLTSGARSRTTCPGKINPFTQWSGLLLTCSRCVSIGRFLPGADGAAVTRS